MTMRRQLRFEVFETTDGEWGWTLFNCKGEAVAASCAAMPTKEQAHREVQFIKGNAQRAKVIEQPMARGEASLEQGIG